MKKLSNRQIKRISKRQDDFFTLLGQIRAQENPSSNQIEHLIKLMKAKVKQEPSVKEKFKKYKIPISAIDSLSISFTPLNVSAKTKNKKIYLNQNMLHADSEVEDPTSYLSHEIVHVLQQLTGNIRGHENPDYLSKETEQEAFEVQIKYKKHNEGKENAEEYVEDLLSYHGKSGKEKQKIKEKINGK